MKPCTKCGESQPLTAFCTDRQKRDGLTSHCRTCIRRASERYRTSPTGRVMRREQCRRKYWRDPAKAHDERRRYHAAHPEWVRARITRVPPEKERARRILQQAVRCKRVTKPNHCQRCTTPVPDPRLLHGHHHDYTQPLNVEWICPRCHGLEHRLKGRAA